MLQGTKIDRLVPRLTSPTPLTIRVQPLMATQHFEAQALLEPRNWVGAKIVVHHFNTGKLQSSILG